MLAAYPENASGVKSDGFCNTSRVALEGVQNVLDRAKNECAVNYDTVDVSYDSTATIWQIQFRAAETASGSQMVYMDGYGVTCLVVYGE